MTQFVVCIVILFALAAPAFYYLTKNYYAEDMADLIEAIQAGKSIPLPDLEADVMKGIMIQYVLITLLLAAATVVTVRLVSRRIWKPFYQTLDQIEDFSIESASIPQLPQTDVAEFEALNTALSRLMNKSVDSYQAQKEFTENASHELQTPLAIFQTRLELLMQQPELSAEQASIIQDLFQMTARLSRLNRNLLLLAKIDNAQFDTHEDICMDTFIDQLLPRLESIANGLNITKHYPTLTPPVQANRSLLESMVYNLVVNAVRHNRAGGSITITVTAKSMAVANTSDEPALPADRIFDRFYRPTQAAGGNGLGLAIVKAICTYHGWNIAYSFTNGTHCFTVDFL